MKKLYQTLEDRNNPEQIESDGPFKCRTLTSWLGEGYYFWDSFIELAHFWGNNSNYTDYVICQAQANLNDSNCYDLAGNPDHLMDFRRIKDIMQSRGMLNKTTSVRRIITFMRQENLFTHSAVRVHGINSISNHPDNSAYTMRLQFIEHKQSGAYLDMLPPIQICIFNCAKVGLTDYHIVFPEIYVDGYLV